MKIKHEGPVKPEPPTPAELCEKIVAAHGRLPRAVSHDRQHAVESQLRVCIRILGFRPRETQKKPAKIGDLCIQLQQAMSALDGVVPEPKYDSFFWHASAVLSNLVAEISFPQGHVLREVPVPESPEAGAHDNNKQ